MYDSAGDSFRDLFGSGFSATTFLMSRLIKTDLITGKVVIITPQSSHTFCEFRKRCSWKTRILGTQKQSETLILVSCENCSETLQIPNRNLWDIRSISKLARPPQYVDYIVITIVFPFKDAGVCSIIISGKTFPTARFLRCAFSTR